MIISAFPGTGKTFLTKEYPELFYDSDSSKFSWLPNGERNPNFINDYVNYIEEALNDIININTTQHIIFISSHEDVRNELIKRGIKFTFIYPHRSLKEHYIQRYKDRNSPDSFISLMENKWDEMIDSCERFEESKYCHKIVLTREDHYLFGVSNVLTVIMEN